MPKSILLFALGVSIIFLGSCRSIETESLWTNHIPAPIDQKEGDFHAQIP